MCRDQGRLHSFTGYKNLQLTERLAKFSGQARAGDYNLLKKGSAKIISAQLTQHVELREILKPKNKHPQHNARCSVGSVGPFGRGIHFPTSKIFEEWIEIYCNFKPECFAGDWSWHASQHCDPSPICAFEFYRLSSDGICEQRSKDSFR